MDSVKITSWNPKTNDYVYFSDAVKYDELQYINELRPYIKVNSGATGPTIIQNSELAYLGYSVMDVVELLSMVENIVYYKIMTYTIFTKVSIQKVWGTW